MKSIYKRSGAEVGVVAARRAGKENFECPLFRSDVAAMRLASMAFEAAGEKTRRARMQSRNPGANLSTDPPISAACPLSNHSAHDNKPTRCVYPPERENYRIDLAELVE